VDFVRPVQSLIPGAQGRVLDVLARTTAELNLGTVARLAGVSPAQASRVLPRLVALGVVERRDVPPASLYRLVHENLMAQAVVDLVEVRERTIDRLRVLAGAIHPAPASLVLFGSLARGEADADSDIDVLMVRRADVDEDDERWNRTLGDWLIEARRATGNPVNHLEVSAAQVPSRLRSRKPMWRDVQRDGVLLYGKPLAQLEEAGVSHRARRIEP
jgi:DNA-binding MarR family transcriptional regulator